MHGEWNRRELRAALAAIQDEGLSQGDIAKLAGVNRSQVSRWTRGENRPTHDKALLLARRIARAMPSLAARFMAASAYSWDGEPEPEAGSGDSAGIVPQDVWEQGYLADPDLDDDAKLLLITTHRRVRDELSRRRESGPAASGDSDGSRRRPPERREGAS